MNQREIKQSIKDNPNLTATEKSQKLNEVRALYKEMTDEELLQLVRDFTEENGRKPMQADARAGGGRSGCTAINPFTTHKIVFT